MGKNFGIAFWEKHESATYCGYNGAKIQRVNHTRDQAKKISTKTTDRNKSWRIAHFAG